MATRSRNIDIGCSRSSGDGLTKRHLNPLHKRPKRHQLQEFKEIQDLPETVPRRASQHTKTLKVLAQKKYILHSAALDKLKNKIILIDNRVEFDVTAWCLKLR